MKNMNTLQDLKEKAFKISKPIAVKYPYEYIDFFDPSKQNYKNNTYDIFNHQVIAFFTENVLYVIPFTYKATEILENADFRLLIEDDDMYIPFSEGDYPLERREKWNALLEEALKQRSEEFIYECIEWCDVHKIGALNECLLEKCFEIPKEGLSVDFENSISKFYPISFENWADFMKKLGHYNSQSGTHIFVYRNGKTYVTRSYEVVIALRKANYNTNYNMEVPPLNDVIILDKNYAQMWEKVKAST